MTADKKPPAPIIAFKGFDMNLACRGYQFEIGATYEHKGKVEACESGFHACENPLDVFQYYSPGISRFAQVRQDGEIARHSEDSKIASARILIEAEIRLPDFIAAVIKYVFAKATLKDGVKSVDGRREAVAVTGDSSAASATGYSSAASATGDRSAASATGDSSAASATGDSSAASATGYSSAASATGYSSAASATGDRSAASATGDSSAASATGDSSAASATGDRSAASATGYSSAASATGYSSAAMACGAEGKVSGINGCALFLVYRRPCTWEILHAWAGVVGQGGIKPDVFYTLDAAGKPMEVGK